MEDPLRVFFEDTVARCTSCGICKESHQAAHYIPFMFGEIAARILDIDAALPVEQERIIPDELLYLIRGCALCDECTVFCPADISASDFMRNARAFLDDAQPSRIDGYQALRTDRAGHLFDMIRLARGIVFDDILADDDASSLTARTVFFPGCSLSAYAPELTTQVADYLVEEASSGGLTLACCGNPLRDMGALGAYQAYAADLGHRLQMHGVKRLIIACPNCFDALSDLKEAGMLAADLQLTPLPEFLVIHGFSVDAAACRSRGIVSASIHDACHDRFSQRFARAIRFLVSGVLQLREMEHTGCRTICCGAGGLVSSFDWQRCVQRAERRQEEFLATGADALLTGCVSCSSSLRRADGALPVYHYLELLFDSPIDWDACDKARSGADDGGRDGA
jgi:fumarate reductase (CoM/CoB) subunit B